MDVRLRPLALRIAAHARAAANWLGLRAGWPIGFILSVPLLVAALPLVRAVTRWALTPGSGEILLDRDRTFQALRQAVSEHGPEASSIGTDPDVLATTFGSVSASVISASIARVALTISAATLLIAALAFVIEVTRRYVRGRRHPCVVGPNPVEGGTYAYVHGWELKDDGWSALSETNHPEPFSFVWLRSDLVAPVPMMWEYPAARILARGLRRATALAAGACMLLLFVGLPVYVWSVLTQAEALGAAFPRAVERVTGEQPAAATTETIQGDIDAAVDQAKTQLLPLCMAATSLVLALLGTGLAWRRRRQRVALGRVPRRHDWGVSYELGEVVSIIGWGHDWRAEVHHPTGLLRRRRWLPLSEVEPISIGDASAV